MKTTHKDIDNAEANWIQHAGNQTLNDRAHVIWHGNEANKLLNSPDFNYLPFVYSVWEVTNDTYDNQTDASKFACIHRANQSTLQGALKYMTSDNRVLVENMHPCSHQFNLSPVSRSKRCVKCGYITKEI